MTKEQNFRAIIEQRIMLRNGGITIVITANRCIELTWLTIQVKPNGLQILADCALRIDPNASAYGFSLFGFGIATARIM